MGGARGRVKSSMGAFARHRPQWQVERMAEVCARCKLVVCARALAFLPGWPYNFTPALRRCFKRPPTSRIPDRASYSSRLPHCYIHVP